MRAWFENWIFDTILRRRYPVHVAQTDAEREAVYRFRYDVYLKEQGDRDHPEVDEARGWLHGPADHDPATTIYYVGTPERLVGTVRIRVWAPGQVPEDARRLHSIDRLPGAESRTIGDIKMLMLTPEARGGPAAPAMLVGALLHATRDRPVDLWFATGAPGMIKHYRKLGFDPHGGRFAVIGRGLVVSLLGLSGDLDVLRRRGSPIYKALSRMPQSGLPVETFRAAIDGDRSVTTDTATLREVVRRAAQEPGHVFHGLSDAALDVIADASVLLELSDDERLIREGFIGKELYVVLEGNVDVSRAGQRLDTRVAGQAVGEVAFLGVASHRTADCDVRGRTRVLALRPALLRLLAGLRADHDLLRGRLVEASQRLQAREGAMQR